MILINDGSTQHVVMLISHVQIIYLFIIIIEFGNSISVDNSSNSPDMVIF